MNYVVAEYHKILVQFFSPRKFFQYHTNCIFFKFLPQVDVTQVRKENHDVRYGILH